MTMTDQEASAPVWPDPQVELDAAQRQFDDALRQHREAERTLADAEVLVAMARQRRDAALAVFGVR